MTGSQRTVLEGIAEYQGVCTPQGLANQLSIGSSICWTWQGVARIAAQLQRSGHVKVTRYPKMTMYELTPAGREEAGDQLHRAG